ncbi:MAG: TatD family hydrolase [bacterium]|nr:TatD family hydrolase [bacterium]
MLIDTHSHLNFNAYKNDADEVIKRALDNDIWMLNVGSQFSTSKRAVEIAEKYPKGVYAAVGLHPIHLTEGIFKTKIDTEEIEFKKAEEDFYYEKYKELARSKKVVAIGEVGLDYYYRPKTKTKLEQFKNKQKEALLAQLALAKELNLPVIFHCRSAHKDLIEILNYKTRTTNYKPNGVVHCFTGNLEEAKQYLELGLYLGLNGIIFKLEVAETSSHLSSRAASPHSVLDEVIKNIPLNRILVETDCPYLTPPPFEGRNEPLYIKSVVQRIAEIKNMNYEEIAKITTENAKKLFTEFREAERR